MWLVNTIVLYKLTIFLFAYIANLTPNETIRKSIPEVSWHIIKKYFPDAIPLAAGEKEDCEECLVSIFLIIVKSIDFFM